MYGINGEIMLDHSTQYINCQTKHLMTEESMELIRKPSREELDIIRYLVDKADYNNDNWQEGLMVRKLPEGMGSLKLLYPNIDEWERQFGRQISDVCFKDVDSVDVIVSLYVDTDNRLYELDVWKTDYSDLIQISRFEDS